MKDFDLKTIDVTCAIIVNDNYFVLATQRSATMSLPLKWEFPGGKIEPEETAENCLIREIKEELDIEIEILKRLDSNKHSYPTIIVNLIPFMCRQVGGVISLKEHANYKWLYPNELLDLDWADADIPIVKNCLNYLNAI